jgi:hypothetical protein
MREIGLEPSAMSQARGGPLFASAFLLHKKAFVCYFIHMMTSPSGNRRNVLSEPSGSGRKIVEREGSAFLGHSIPRRGDWAFFLSKSQNTLPRTGRLKSPGVRGLSQGRPGGALVRFVSCPHTSITATRCHQLPGSHWVAAPQRSRL